MIFRTQSIIRCSRAVYRQCQMEYSSKVNHGFPQLGLINSIVEGLNSEGFNVPTKVQEKVIPRLVNKENIVFSASTGSGKTLAYTLPVMNNLILAEQAGYIRQHQRPRCLILVPTRELATQVLKAIKVISHFAKVSSCAILGGESYSVQKKMLNSKFDILVSSPGRLVKHLEQKNVFLREVDCVVIDEADTMLTQGFGADIRTILQGVIMPRQQLLASHGPARPAAQVQLPQLVMASATLSSGVKSLLDDVRGFRVDTPGHLLHTSNTQRVRSAIRPKDNDEGESNQARINLDIVEIEGTHRSLSSVTHEITDLQGKDKLQVLEAVLRQYNPRGWKTMIFCNTIASCRAVAYALDGMLLEAGSYHGELDSSKRAANLSAFRDSTTYQYLVCSDIAARGLDISGVDHVIMFDFPLNPIDYLHRAGRTGRMGAQGLVTSLVAKRDRVLAHAIDTAIKKGLPLDKLSSRKKDYQDSERVVKMVGVKPQSLGVAIGQQSSSLRKISRSQANQRIVSDPKRPGIHVRQPPKRMSSRTSRMAMASESHKHRKIGATAIMRERRQEHKVRRKTGGSSAFRGEEANRSGMGKRERNATGKKKGAERGKGRKSGKQKRG